MIVFRLKGGLGNQMFQYATALKLMNQGKKVAVDHTRIDNDNLRKFELDIFPNIKFHELHKVLRIPFQNNLIGKTLRVIAKKLGFYLIESTENELDNRILNCDHRIIDGYFQSERYFEDIRDIIISAFEFPSGEELLEEIINKINTDRKSVSIHIRRGDYLDNDSIYGGICTVNYYDKAIKLMRDKGLDSFYIFSDDVDWVKKNLVIDNAHFISKNMFERYHDWYDMAMMSKCKGNIIANSTFSWWGAWLNRCSSKVVVCPTKWDNIQKRRKPACKGWVEVSA